MNFKMTSILFHQEQLTLALPDKEIEEIFSLQGSLSVEESLTIFQKIISKISHWLESVHLAVFSLEQNIKNEESHDEDNILPVLESTIHQMAPFINSLSDLNDILLNKGVEEEIIKITKIQSEWSSLQHYLASVKQQILINREQHDLVFAIEKLLLQIDDVSTMMFDFQEKKQQHSNIMSPTSSLSERAYNDDLFSIGSNSDSSTLVTMTTSFTKEDGMMEIDSAFESILNQIQIVYTRMNQIQPQELTRKRFEKLKDKWDQLQSERDELKYEYKEDRWLTVFRRVSDQVDVMIDGLDRSVAQCYSFIQQIKEWYNHQLQIQQQSNYKSLLRPFQQQQQQPQQCPIDKEKFKSIEKSFEAKYKYYTPSIDRMLTILGNGILSRGSKDTIIQQRHESMLQRWTQLKNVMNELRLRDLMDVERMILGSSQKKQSSWKEIRYRTPEPENAKPRPQPSLQPPSSLRGSISDSSTSSQHLRKTKTPRPTRNESIQKREDFYEEDERHFGVDLFKYQVNNNNNQSRITRIQHIERPSTTQDIRPRAKTPVKRSLNHQQSTVGLRSKSSLGDLRMDRVMSPSVRTRSVTPSLIPRPKTPKEMSRATSPMIPQPKPTVKTIKLPPVPPLPKYVTDNPSVIRRKQSMPVLRHKTSNIEISVHEDCMYHPDPKDPLDVEVAQIMNASPITIRCQRAEPGKYYFGNELSLSSMGGKKLYTCKLMTYTNRKGGQFKNNKVLIRVGGGWQDLEFFLLEHSSLMATDVVVRSYAGNQQHQSVSDTSSRSKGWKN
ncbi:unnamed protein product [Rhizopus microsporus]